MILLLIGSVSAADYCRTINMTQIETVNGIYDSGSLSTISILDAINYTVNETTTTPGFAVYFNATASNITHIAAYAAYEGNVGHNVDLELYNYSGSAWEDIADIPHGQPLAWYNKTLNSSDWSDNNIIQGRIIHSTAGASGHFMYIDYIEMTSCTYITPTPDADDIYVADSCPLASLQQTLLYMFIIFFAFALVALSVVSGVAFLGLGGGAIMLITSFTMLGCNNLIGVFMTGLSIIIIAYHGLIQN